MNGDWVSGPEELTEEELGANRRNFYEDCLARKLDTDEFWQSRMPDWSKVQVPLLSTANWGGQGLHPRGNFEGFVRAASKQKWLECHGIEHWTHFYTDYGVALLGQAAQGTIAGATYRQVHRAPRFGVAAQEHPMGQVFPQPG